MGSNTVLFDQGGHRNILLEDFSEGAAVQANQHLIIHGKEAMILDPGGHKIYNKALSATFNELGGAKLTHLFFSHQDPDIVAAANGWLMTTDAEGYVSALWQRFVPHFGLDRLVVSRLHAIPDEGTRMLLDGAELIVLPAHFLHSCGNFHVYDTVSKVLYSGDLGASLGQDYVKVPDFDAHLKYITGFHKRYMACNKALRAWADMVRQLDIETIAPQHGAMFCGPEMSRRFIDWCADLECGVDVMGDIYRIPA